MKLGLGLGITGGNKLYSYQPETKTLLSALSGTYSTARKKEIDKLIKSLKTAGIWVKLDVLQMYAAPTAADAVVNWRNPGTFNATLVNSPTLEVNRGINGDRVSSYIDSQYIPSTSSLKYTINDCSVGAYFRSVSTPVGMDLGILSGSNHYVALSNSVTDFQRVNGTTAFTRTVGGNLGLFGYNRISATQIVAKNNSDSEIITSNSTAIPPTYSIILGGYRGTSAVIPQSNAQISLFFAGGNLESEWASFLSAIETYLDYIGAGVVS